VIFDQFGRPKYQQHKPLLDWTRETRRLRNLASTAEANAVGAIGGRPNNRAEPLAALHRPRDLWIGAMVKLVAFTVRMCNVGFGDCFLLSFNYGLMRPSIRSTTSRR
jgi:hypothetical protein